MTSGPSTRAAFEELLSSLVGREIIEVTYFEIQDGGAPHWNQQSPSFDSLDYGLRLALDDGSPFDFTWGTEFTQYNLSLARCDWGFAGVRALDATERWRHLLGRPVTAATATWLPSWNDGPEYPQDAWIDFDADAVVVSAFEVRNGKPIIGATDHITVFFDQDEAAHVARCSR